MLVKVSGLRNNEDIDLIAARTGLTEYESEAALFFLGRNGRVTTDTNIEKPFYYVLTPDGFKVIHERELKNAEKEHNRGEEKKGNSKGPERDLAAGEGCRARPKAVGSGPTPAGVRRFKSGPSHSKPLRAFCDSSLRQSGRLLRSCSVRILRLRPATQTLSFKSSLLHLEMLQCFI